MDSFIWKWNFHFDTAVLSWSSVYICYKNGQNVGKVFTEQVKREMTIIVRWLNSTISNAFTEAAGVETSALLLGEFSHSRQSSGQKHIRGHQRKRYTHILTYIFNEHPGAKTLPWLKEKLASLRSINGFDQHLNNVCVCGGGGGGWLIRDGSRRGDP